jgi:hypothetical protein
LRKIAIFTEGQTELIFIRNFLLRIMDPAKISFVCFELLAHQQFPVPFKYENAHSEVHFLILNVHGDEGVLSSIKERETNLFEKGGYDLVIGLRDMYSEEYFKRSQGIISEQISSLFIRQYDQTIVNMKHFDKIRFFFAIMEIEAWFLGMYTLFCKIAPLLTVSFIKEQTSIDLKTTDPQKSFFQPSKQLDQIFQLCGREYKKKQGEVENICGKIDPSDINAACENSRCTSLNKFYQELLNCL